MQMEESMGQEGDRYIEPNDGGAIIGKSIEVSTLPAYELMRKRILHWVIDRVTKEQGAKHLRMIGQQLTEDVRIVDIPNGIRGYLICAIMGRIGPIENKANKDFDGKSAKHPSGWNMSQFEKS